MRRRVQGGRVTNVGGNKRALSLCWIELYLAKVSPHSRTNCGEFVASTTQSALKNVNLNMNLMKGF